MLGLGFYFLISKILFGEIWGLDAKECKRNLTLHCVCEINSDLYTFSRRKARG